jgi:iron transport multicopper oxidase
MTFSSAIVHGNGVSKYTLLINGAFLGPTFRVPAGDYLDIKLTNNIGDQMTLVHWHGVTQRGTGFMDGPPGLVQCPLNTINTTSNQYLDPLNAVDTMHYKFHLPDSGTNWYHGHIADQPVDGIAGALIVEDTPAITAEYAKYGATYTAETLLVLTDFYNAPAKTYLPWYLSPASGGNEPMPDAIAVNGLLTDVMSVNVSKADKLRVRVICGSAFSMFNVSVDGMPLTVIELDGAQTQPFDVSHFVINTGQRVSFILDWTKLPASMTSSSSVLFRVSAIPDMYPTYNTSLPNFGLFGTASNSPFNLYWTGKFFFTDLAVNNNGNPSYNVINPPRSSAGPPSDTNLLQALPLFALTVPPPDLNLHFIIEFFNDAQGVNRPHVNRAIYPGETHKELGSPVLYEYMSAKGGPLLENTTLPKGGWIPGDGANPFVLPYGRAIDVWFNNTDGGEHPMHLHGHNFWIIESSQYNVTQPILRDTISIAGNGWARVRFVADNPGVWFLHCHIDWHLDAGLAAYFIEAPSKLTGTIDTIPADHRAACAPFFASTAAPTTI